MKSLKIFSLIFTLILITFNIEVKAEQYVALQENVIKGKVVDVNGESIIGATIQVLESKEGVITNFEGDFIIKAPQNGHLLISYVGYESQKVEINGKNKLYIVLKEENTVLDEVVVVGYGTIKRKEMTSAISHINAKDLNKISSLDASMLLQGKVSSVSVSNTAVADPNSTGSIQIRGVSSRNASLSPLVVIDGIPGGD